MKNFSRKIIAAVCLTAFAFALVTPADAGRPGRPVVIVVPTDPKPVVSAP